uniref:CNH domain-containing protein n=1 Tax=Chromera velia CCMP2878 TaxID=1169474 RepID=A0A0G4H2Y9_9ALVE|eukprot:Cvel_24491.t1-p1 / transcript=Cvel_24491.t1 / gene=Cvel_24491 / organism=Chromera_velia_CCMP2878 / gene_product=Transforming growth factor-beta receptor-associated, putative / transcript_product=Transforming growth factor-beta receptor-associated, putative / location=Cvel_scaffold2655:14247-23112(-) / protein_length=1423 / sequence_SO=supercontig / SO=protein_coding / is_pseudo=false
MHSSIYLGTKSGVIHHYKISPGKSPEEFVNSARLQGTLRLNGRKRVDQLLAIPDRQILLALSDGNVQAMSGSLDSQGITLCKGASAMCLHTLATLGSGVLAASADVAVATKKKLILFTHTGTDFVIRKEFSCPDAALSLGWHKQWIVAGFRREYLLVDETDGSSREIFAIDQRSCPIPRVSVLAHDELLLLCQEGLGVFFSLAALQPAQKNTIQWPRGLCCLGTSTPFVFGGALGRELEVYSVRDQKHCQTMTVDGLRCLSGSEGSGRTFAASEFSVFAIAPVPYESQLQKLLLSLRIPDALELLNANFGPDDPQRETELRKLHMLAGWSWFVDLQFPVAFQHFGLSDTDIQHLLEFWREWLPPNFPKGPNRPRLPKGVVRPFSSSSSSSATEKGKEGDGGGDSPTTKRNKAALFDFIPSPEPLRDFVTRRLAEKQRAPKETGAAPEKPLKSSAGPTSMEGLSASVAALEDLANSSLATFLLKERAALMGPGRGHQREKEGSSRGAEAGGAFGSPEGLGGSVVVGSEELLGAVDSLLLKLLVKEEDGRWRDLLRDGDAQRVRCEIAEVAPFLRSRHRLDVLAVLCRHHGFFHDALSLLAQLLHALDPLPSDPPEAVPEQLGKMKTTAAAEKENTGGGLLASPRPVHAVGTEGVTSEALRVCVQSPFPSIDPLAELASTLQALFGASAASSAASAGASGAKKVSLKPAGLGGSGRERERTGGPGISKSETRALLLLFSPMVIDRDRDLALRVFTGPSATLCPLTPQEILSMLTRPAPPLSPSRLGSGGGGLSPSRRGTGGREGGKGASGGLGGSAGGGFGEDLLGIVLEGETPSLSAECRFLEHVLLGSDWAQGGGGAHGGGLGGGRPSFASSQGHQGGHPGFHSQQGTGGGWGSRERDRGEGALKTRLGQIYIGRVKALLKECKSRGVCVEDREGLSPSRSFSRQSQSQIQKKEKEGEGLKERLKAEVAMQRLKLIRFLEVTAGYDADLLLEAIGGEAEGKENTEGGGGELIEERVVLLGKKGCHGEALRILVQTLKDMPAAEAYCHSLNFRNAQTASQGHGGGSGMLDSHRATVVDGQLAAAAAAAGGGMGIGVQPGGLMARRHSGGGTRLSSAGLQSVTSLFFPGSTWRLLALHWEAVAANLRPVGWSEGEEGGSRGPGWEMEVEVGGLEDVGLEGGEGGLKRAGLSDFPWDDLEGLEEEESLRKRVEEQGGENGGVGGPGKRTASGRARGADARGLLTLLLRFVRKGGLLLSLFEVLVDLAENTNEKLEPGKGINDANTLTGEVEGEPSAEWFRERALDLLRKYRAHPDLEPAGVLEVVPDHWPLSGLSSFLRSALRRSVHSQRATEVQRALSSAAYLATFCSWADARARRVQVSAERSCSVCGRRIGDKAIVAHPNGSILHVACAYQSAGAAATAGLGV